VRLGYFDYLCHGFFKCTGFNFVVTIRAGAFLTLPSLYICKGTKFCRIICKYFGKCLYIFNRNTLIINESQRMFIHFTYRYMYINTYFSPFAYTTRFGFYTFSQGKFTKFYCIICQYLRKYLYIFNRNLLIMRIL